MAKKPLILVTNDDGISAPGIRTLISVMNEIGDVVVVAPDSPQSAMGHAITINSTLQCHKIKIDDGPQEEYTCSGTPADCVKLGINEILNKKPDICVSGINHGANIGTDVIYSGTVGAAAGGRGLKYPPIAISAETYEVKDLDYICRKSCEFVNKFSKDKNKFLGNLVNINFPDLIESDVNGVRATSLAQRGVPQKPIVNGDYYRYNFSGIPMKSSDSLTDAQALSDGYISVSLLDYSFGAINNIDQIKDII